MSARVLMTADAVGGVWTYAIDLARALVPLGFDTTLAVMGPAPRPDQIAEAAAVPHLDLIAGAFALEWMDDAWDDVRTAGTWLLGLAAKVQPTLVHLNGYAHGSLSWRCPVVVVGHSCVASWQDAVGGDIDPAWLRRYRAIVSSGLRAADHVVAPSAAMLAALRRHYGPLPDASVVPNGRNPSACVTRVKEPFVLTAGRLWDRAKNVDAVRAVADRIAWPLVTAEGLSRRDICDLLARAAIFALPARYEPFGLLPLEAALSGCALVLGDIASLREVWGDAAVYVDPDDRRGLQAAIESLIVDAARRDEFARRAAQRATRFTPERMAAEYARLYRSQLPASRLASKAS